MTLQHVNLAYPTQLPSSVGAMYDNGSSVKTYIRGIILHNTNTTTETVELQMVQNSSGSLGTPAASKKFLHVDLATNETLFIEFISPIILTAQHDAIFGVTTTASKVNFIPLGDKE